MRADSRRRHYQRSQAQGVAQPTKQGWLYVFDRVTGDRSGRLRSARSTSATCRESRRPTQPFVTKPPAFDRQGVAMDDLIDFTPELKAEAVKLA